LLTASKRVRPETPSALWQEAGRVCSQTQQSLLRGTSYSSVLDLEAFVCIKGGGRLAAINPVYNVILFYQHPGLERLEEGREAGAAGRNHVAQLAPAKLPRGVYTQQPGPGSLLPTWGLVGVDSSLL